MNHDQTTKQIAKLQAQDYLGLKLSDQDRLMQVAEEAMGLSRNILQYCKTIEGSNPLTKDPSYYWDYVQTSWNHLIAAADISPLEADEDLQLRMLNLWKARIEWLEPKQEQEETTQAAPDYFQNVEETTVSAKFKEEDDELLRPFFPELEEDEEDE